MHLGHETQALQPLLSLLGDKKCSGQHFMVNCQRWDPSKAKKLNRKNVTAITTKYSTSMISNLPCHQQCHAMSHTSRTPRIEPGAGQLRSTNAPSVLCRTPRCLTSSTNCELQCSSWFKLQSLSLRSFLYNRLSKSLTARNKFLKQNKMLPFKFFSV